MAESDTKQSGYTMFDYIKLAVFLVVIGLVLLILFRPEDRRRIAYKEQCVSLGGQPHSETMARSLSQGILTCHGKMPDFNDWNGP